MKHLPPPTLAQSPRFRDNSTRVLLPVLLLSLPFFGLLWHCANHITSNHGTGEMPEFEVVDSTLSSTKFLYVASYDGSVTTLEITRNGHSGWGLEPVATTEGCAGSPSWLTLDAANEVLYCTDEGLSTADAEGSLSSFRIVKDGSLVRLGRVRTVVGPVSAAVYGKDGNGIAVAHYGGSALTTWDIKDPVDIQSVQTRLFKQGQPGPDPARQDAPHPHAAVVDPKGKFILVPDLGSDLVRVYAINDDDLNIEEREPLAVAAGSGPRHVVFAETGEKTFLYLVTELGNTIVGYEAAYDNDTIAFEQVWTSGIHGMEKSVPDGAAASEIIVSPDSNFLILSSRFENTHDIPNFDPSNSTQIKSDPLVNFAIDPESGHLELLQEVPCGGQSPRQFSINKEGSLVAVALQKDGRVVLIRRNVDTGDLGEIVAYASIEGEVTTVIFDE